MYTREQIEEGIIAMESQGAPPEDVQAWLDSLDTKTAEAPVSGERGFLQNMATEIIEPAIKVGSTMQKGIMDVLGAKYTDPEAQVALESRSAKNLTEFTGAGLEVASYGIAPLRAGKGFWGAVKSIQPVAATMGAAEGLQQVGEGKGIGEAAVEAGKTYMGVSTVGGLFGMGGELIKNWGAKLMQSKAVQESMKNLKELADDIYTTIPEAFKDGFINIKDLTNKNTQRAADALRKRFDTEFAIAKNNIIDAAVPTVKNSEVATARFNHAISKARGDYFRDEAGNELYHDVKADLQSITGFLKGAPGKILSKIPSLGSEQDRVMQMARAGALTEGGRIRGGLPSEGVLQEFKQTMQQSLDQKLTLRQVLNLWDESLGYLSRANNTEKATIRDFAASLFAHTKGILEKENKELLGKWETAWSRWGEASRLYESPLLSEFSFPGRIDNYIQKIAAGKITAPEYEVIQKALADPKTRQEAQDLLITSLLRTTKIQSPKDASALINDFLNTFEPVGAPGTFLEPEARTLLGNMALFFDNNFDSFIGGMNNTLKGLPVEAAESLGKMKGQIDAFELVKNKGLDQITAQLLKIKDLPEFSKLVSAMSDDEKKAIGLAITKDFFDKNTKIATQISGGKYKVEESYADTIIKTWNMISENKTLQDVLGENTVLAFEKAAQKADLLRDAAYETTATGMSILFHAIVASLYVRKGWIPGALSNAIKTSGTQTDITGRASRAAAINELVEMGVIKPGITFTLGDFVGGVVGSTLGRGAGVYMSE